MQFLDHPDGRAYARVVGLFYLVIAFAGGYAILYVPSQIIVPDDPAASLANIMERRGLYLSGLLGDVVMMLAEVVVTAMLFVMFRATNLTLAVAAALARFAMVAVMAAMLFFHAGAVYLADPGAAFASLDTTARADLAGLMFHVHDAGVWIWQIFFFIHLLLLGTLVILSRKVPRIFGWGMVVGGLGYLFDTMSAFAFPDATLLAQVTVVLLLIVTLAEVGFALWLLIMGQRPTHAGA